MKLLITDIILLSFLSGKERLASVTKALNNDFHLAIYTLCKIGSGARHSTPLHIISS